MLNKVFKKRTLLIVLAVVLVLSLSLGACSSGGSGGSGSGSNTIKIGFVAPFSGPMAAFTVGAKHTTDEALKIMNADGGIEIAGEKYQVEVIYGDSESDPTKAQEVATKLVTSDKVNILVGEWTPATTSPVSAVGEKNQVPTLVANGPDTSWLEGGPYDWSFGLLFDYDKFIDEYFNGWDKMDTNKKIGLVLDSNVDGVGMAQILTEKAKERGYTVVDPGRFPEGTKDYMQVITEIQSAGCDIFVASLLTPELATLWDQCKQLNYIPKTAVLSKGMHMVTDLKTLGEGNGENVTIETQWSPKFPFTSSLSGKTAQELSDEFSAALNESPDLTIGWDWSIYDVIADVLSRTKSTSAEDIRDAFASTSIDCIYGHVEFNDEQVGHVPIVFGQWVLDDTWVYAKNIIAAGHVPEITELSEPLYIPNFNSSN